MTNELLTDDLKRKIKNAQIHEKVDFNPGEKVTDRMTAMLSSGAGSQGQRYVVVHVPILNGQSSADMKKSVELWLPNATIRHHLGLLKRKREGLMRDDKNRNLNRQWVQKYITPVEEGVPAKGSKPAEPGLREKLKETQKVHNTEDLHALHPSIYTKAHSLKIATPDVGSLDPDKRKRMELEFLIMKDLHHPNIPEVIEPIDIKKGTGYVTRICDGRTLNEILSETCWRTEGQEFMDPEVVLATMIQIYETRAYIQDKFSDTQRRELMLDDDDQLSNFMVDFDGKVNLIDPFAVGVGGIPKYFAREKILQLKQSGNGFSFETMPYEHKSGVWSLGTVAYIMACSKHQGDHVEIQYPFEGETFVKVQESIEKNQKKHPSVINNHLFTKAEIKDLIDAPHQDDLEKRPDYADMAYRLKKHFERRVGNVTTQYVLREKVMNHIKEKRDGEYSTAATGQASPTAERESLLLDDED